MIELVTVVALVAIVAAMAPPSVSRAREQSSMTSARQGLTATLVSARASAIQVGAVVCILRPVRYSLYEAASGRWYLGFEEQQRGAWSTVEPVSGPYVASTGGAGSGLQFAYFDTLGVSTTDASRLGRVDVALRGASDLARVPERHWTQMF